MPSQVFTVPKLLRPYFMHHRELLGPLCTAAWQTVRELMANLHPHVHALVTRGGWTASGEWVPVPSKMLSAVLHRFASQC
jgi:Putative transposase